MWGETLYKKLRKVNQQAELCQTQLSLQLYSHKLRASYIGLEHYGICVQFVIVESFTAHLHNFSTG